VGAELSFLGAAGTVTGSRHLVRSNWGRLLIDCGLFQGLKELRERNWTPFPVKPRALDAVLLTHAHIDHSGYLPRLVAQGFRGPIWATPATADLCRIMLLDSAHLQEEEAEYANRKGHSRHHPALPLYTVAEAEVALRRLRELPYGQRAEVAPGIDVRLSDAGHILGSAIAELWVAGAARSTDGDEPDLVASGDLGRYGTPIVRDPTPIAAGRTLILESTYGDRLHPTNDPAQELARVVRETAARGGILVVPSFAVGRTQDLLYNLRALQAAGAVPVLPITVDSPMAVEATDLYVRHREDHDLETLQLEQSGIKPLAPRGLSFARTREQSMALNEASGPAIIIAASGMVTGGRILHHLRRLLPDPRTTVLFVGYQGAGTRGRLLLDGAPQIKMFGEMVPVRARIERIDGFSAHADQNEILRWLGGFRQPPAHTYLVHGEDGAATTLAALIHERMGWTVSVATDGQTVPL
jgi:metallo-beta-lactamase family protein